MVHNRAIIFGTWDLFHVGHLRAIVKARRSLLNGELVVGVEADALASLGKGEKPVICEAQRLEIVSAVKAVDKAFIYQTHEYMWFIRKHEANCLVWCRDNCHEERHAELLRDAAGAGVTIIYIDRCPDISTTAIRERIRDR